MVRIIGIHHCNKLKCIFIMFIFLLFDKFLRGEKWKEQGLNFVLWLCKFQQSRVSCIVLRVDCKVEHHGRRVRCSSYRSHGTESQEGIR